MANSTFFYFILTGYLDVGALGRLFFVTTAVVYLIILLLNLFLVTVICLNRALHEPMYLFLCSLFVNELYGSTAVFPFLLTQILKDLHTVSVPFCFLQIFCQYTYVTIEFCTLAAMSFDRYLAICLPLQYHTRMNSKKVLIFVISIWLYAFTRCVITLSLNARLTLCGNILDSIYCRNFLIVKLACSDTSVSNAYGLLAVFLSIVLPFVAIILSYIKILHVCFTGSNQTRQKAVNTCTPQLVSILNFCFGCTFEIITGRVDFRSFPDAARMFFTLYYAILQPLLSPILYGLQLNKIRSTCKQLLFTTTSK